MTDTRRVGYNHFISRVDDCFSKNDEEILLDLADFALQEQPEDDSMVAISRAWYNGSYTMAAKPIRTLKLHYPVIQFNNDYLSIITLHLPQVTVTNRRIQNDALVWLSEAMHKCQILYSKTILKNEHLSFGKPVKISARVMFVGRYLHSLGFWYLRSS